MLVLCSHLSPSTPEEVITTMVAKWYKLWDHWYGIKSQKRFKKLERSLLLKNSSKFTFLNCTEGTLRTKSKIIMIIIITEVIITIGTITIIRDGDKMFISLLCRDGIHHSLRTYISYIYDHLIISRPMIMSHFLFPWVYHLPWVLLLLFKIIILIYYPSVWMGNILSLLFFPSPPGTIPEFLLRHCHHFLFISFLPITSSTDLYYLSLFATYLFPFLCVLVWCLCV